jgi:hypothetical protein
LLTGLNSGVSSTAIVTRIKINQSGTILYLIVGSTSLYTYNLSTTIYTLIGNSYRSNGTLDGFLNTVTFDAAGDVYVGGVFTSIGITSGTAVSCSSVAKWNATTSTWSAVISSLIRTSNPNSTSVYSINVSNLGYIYIGGTFDSAQDLSANTFCTSSGADLVRINNYKTISGSNFVGYMYNNLSSIGTNGIINAIAIHSSGDVYIGGTFTTVGGITANNIAKWSNSTSTWSALIASGSNGVTVSSGTAVVNSIVFDPSGNVYAGGTFNTVGGGLTVNNISMWNGSFWSRLKPSAGGSLDGGVTGTNAVINAMVYYNGLLYVGGSFTTIRRYPSIVTDSPNIAIYNLSTRNWNGISNQLNGDVKSLAINTIGTHLIIGGSFTAFGGTSCNKIMKLQLTNYACSIVVGSASNNGVNGTVNSLAFDSQNNLYIGGSGITTAYTSSGSVVPVSNIAKLSGSTWSTFGSASTYGTSGSVISIKLDASDNLYAVGNFATAAGNVMNNIAKWNNSSSTWSSFGSGVNSSITSFGIDSYNTLYAGGYSITRAGGLTRSNILAILQS